MKNQIFIGAIVAILFACEGKQRYTQQSAEIETIKTMTDNYVNGDWDAYQSHYAEGAQIFFNSPEDKPATIQQVIAQEKMELDSFSSYSLDRENEAIEMVLDDKGETWVNYWGVWKGTMASNGKTYQIPIHITSQFVNGKIVKAYGYWDNSPILMDVMAMQMAAEKAEMEAPKPNK
jgi:hypothetical protein